MALPAGVGVHPEHEQLGRPRPVGVGGGADRGEPDDLLAGTRHEQQVVAGLGAARATRARRS